MEGEAGLQMEIWAVHLEWEEVVVAQEVVLRAQEEAEEPVAGQ